MTSETTSTDAIRRNRANVARLEEAVAVAEREQLPAMVLFWHTDIFKMVHAEPSEFGAPISTHALKGGSKGSFDWFALRLAQRAEGFKGQILIVHGDGHRFIVARPMTICRAKGIRPSAPTSRDSRSSVHPTSAAFGSRWIRTRRGCSATRRCSPALERGGARAKVPVDLVEERM